MKRGAFPTQSAIYSKPWADRGLIDAIKWEVLPVPDDALMTLIFESGAAGQGVWMASDGGFRLAGEEFSQLRLWKHTSPETVEFTVKSTDGLLHVYKIWHDERCQGNAASQSHTSAMLKEPVSGGFRYRCNDIGFNEKFDRLVFRIVRNA